MVALIPLAAKTLAKSTQGMMWPFARKGKKIMCSSRFSLPMVMSNWIWLVTFSRLFWQLEGNDDGFVLPMNLLRFVLFIEKISH